MGALTYISFMSKYAILDIKAPVLTPACQSLSKRLARSVSDYFRRHGVPEAGMPSWYDDRHRDTSVQPKVSEQLYTFFNCFDDALVTTS